MAAEASTSFKELFSLGGIPRFLRDQLPLDPRLPDVGGYRLALLLIQAEAGHFGCRPISMWILEPHGNPFLIDLDTYLFKAGAHLFLLAQKAFRLNVELLHLVIDV